VLHVFENMAIVITRTRKINNKIINRKVVDEQVKDIGTITDIFGPVENPYVVIKINEYVKNRKKLLGKLLYIYTKKKR